MPKIKQVQTSMVAGEVSPKMFGRIDIDQYFNGCAKARNVYVIPQGGVFRREGLEYIDNTETNQAARLVSFEFSTVQTYLLVFTPGQMDVYRDGVNQATVTSSPISGLTADIISEMKFTQSADTLILFHVDINPIEITRSSHTSWSAANVSFDYIPKHAFSGASQSAKTTSLSFTAQATADQYKLTDAGAGFLSSHVGQRVIANFGVFEITSYTDASNVIAQVLSDPSGTTSTTSWILETGYENVWSGSRGWPTCGTYFQGRLWLAGGSRPQTAWASVVGSYYDFSLNKGDASDAIDVTIDDDRVNSIQNIFPGRSLQLFTTGGEFFVKGGSLDEPITPGNIQILKGTLHGSESTTPVSVDGSTIFIERGGAVVREFVYTDLEQSFIANDVSRLAPHLVNSPTRMAVRSATTSLPSPYVYMVNNDGTMAVMAISRQEKILAFTLFETEGTFEDVVTVDRDVYVVVARTINSSSVRFIEKLNSDHYLDASVRVDNGSPTTSWSGFDHLDGEEIEVRADNYVFDNETPSSGAITTDSATILEGGLGFSSLFQSMPLDGDIGGQTLTGEWKRLISVNIRLNESRNIIVKRTQSNGSVTTYKPGFRQFGSDVLDDPVQNYTGWKKVYIGGVDRDSQITITQEEPLEFNILSCTFEFGN